MPNPLVQFFREFGKVIPEHDEWMQEERLKNKHAGGRVGSVVDGAGERASERVSEWALIHSIGSRGYWIDLFDKDSRRRRRWRRRKGSKMERSCFPQEALHRSLSGCEIKRAITEDCDTPK